MQNSPHFVKKIHSLLFKVPNLLKTFNFLHFYSILMNLKNIVTVKAGSLVLLTDSEHDYLRRMRNNP